MSEIVGLNFGNTALVVVSLVATASGLLMGGALLYKNYLEFTRRRAQTPTKWVKVGEVDELCVYPVKSFKGIKTPGFECTSLGARLQQIRDRSFVVVDEEGRFVTGRNYPKMCQLMPKISGKSITFSCPDHQEVTLDIDDIQGERKKVKIWDTWTEGIDCGDEIASWLSRCILKQEKGLSLLYCGEVGQGKTVNEKITSYTKMENIQMQKDDGGCFSDATSYHLISQASIKELNSRLDGAQISALNFRPNLIIKGEGLIPFEEDYWRWVKIGKTVFQCLAPCTRCLFTTIDPNTGTKSEEMEPLVSLRRFRHVRDPEKRKLFPTPAMGIYLGLREGDTVSVGDEVFVPAM